jgi:hypothetical protein
VSVTHDIYDSANGNVHHDGEGNYGYIVRGSSSTLILDLARELHRLQDAGWRPIETAPKDTRVLVYATLRGSSLGGHDCGKWVVIAAWETEYGCWVDGSQCTPEPTHWMPLPSPPSGKGGEG